MLRHCGPTIDKVEVVKIWYCISKKPCPCCVKCQKRQFSSTSRTQDTISWSRLLFGSDWIYFSWTTVRLQIHIFSCWMLFTGLRNRKIWRRFRLRFRHFIWIRFRFRFQLRFRVIYCTYIPVHIYEYINIYVYIFANVYVNTYWKIYITYT